MYFSNLSQDAIMPISLLESRHGHQSEETELDQTHIPNTGTYSSTPLMQAASQDEEVTAQKPTLRTRWQRFYTYRIHLYHPDPQKQVTYRVVVFFPLLCLTAFMLFM